MQKTCLCFQNLSMRMHASIYVRMIEACACRSAACMCICVYVYACPRVSLAFLFQKQVIQFIKKLYFFETPLASQFQSDKVLNQYQALEFQHHQGTGSQVVRGTKCGVYNWCSLQVLHSFCSLGTSIAAFVDNQLIGDFMHHQLMPLMRIE